MSFDSATTLMLISVITDRIDNREMFTCYDITRILKNRGCNVKHEDVREVVHGLAGTDSPPFRGSSYKRNSMVRIRNYGVNAEVYAHANDDVNLYDADALNPNFKPVGIASTGTSSVNLTVSAAPTVKKAVKKSKSKGVKSGTKIASKRGKIDDKRRWTSCDSRGRVTIHNGFLKRLGLNKGAKAFVSVRAKNHPGLVVLTSPSRTGHVTTYTVDDSGNIRLSRKTLKSGKVDKVSQFKLRLTDDKRGIVVMEK